MELYHLIGRGVDKRDIVINDSDRLRFLHDLYVFNDEASAPNFILNSRHTVDRKRKCLVDIHAYALMNNHYHLLVSERIENGIPKFMKKLNMGYAKYFNDRYTRSGALWEGKYRKVHIKRDAHFLYIPFYIHLNPLDYTLPKWREGSVTSVNKALKELRAYRWSSYLDYVGTQNFPSIINSKYLSSVLGSSKDQEEIIAQIIQSPESAHASNALEYKN